MFSTLVVTAAGRTFDIATMVATIKPWRTVLPAAVVAVV